MTEFRSTNEAVEAAARRSGVDREAIWGAVRKEFGGVKGSDDARREKVEGFLSLTYPRGAAADIHKSGHMTPAEAGSLLCWRGVPSVGAHCVAGGCMAWRVVQVIAPDGSAADLSSRNTPGFLTIGRCSALPE